MGELRNLKAPIFLLVTEAEHMRGLDYRSQDTITLFMAWKCDSNRSLVQAFGRVGRYASDNCHRLVCSDLKSADCP